jgi:hypothetical protein
MKSLHVEMLLGHNTGMAKNYYRPSEREMLDEYLKAVNLLTINDEYRLQKKVQQLQQQDEYQKYVIDKKIKEMEEQNKILNQKLIKYNKHLEYIQNCEQKINDIMESKFEEQHLNREYESIPTVEDKKGIKDSVFKNLLEIRKKRIKHENDYENLLREGVDNDYYY